MQWREQVILW